jgi:hypothetical protein
LTSAFEKKHEFFKNNSHQNIVNSLEKFGGAGCGTYLRTPIEKLVVKKGQKIFESLEATASR